MSDGVVWMIAFEIAWQNRSPSTVRVREEYKSLRQATTEGKRGLGHNRLPLAARLRSKSFDKQTKRLANLREVVFLKIPPSVFAILQAMKDDRANESHRFHRAMAKAPPRRRHFVRLQ